GAGEEERAGHVMRQAVTPPAPPDTLQDGGTFAVSRQFSPSCCTICAGGATMEPRAPTIGERIMLIRRRRGLTQRDLARKAKMATTALNRLENSVQSVYAERLATLARG